MDNVTYRLANNSVDDIDKLYNLEIEFEKYNKSNSTRPEDHFAGDWEKYFREEIVESLTKEDSWVYVAEINKVMIGFAYSRVCKDCYKFIIDELFVLDKFRSQRIGEKLLEMTINKGKEFEYPIVTEVFDWNDKASEFYRHHNFAIDGHILVYRPK